MARYDTRREAGQLLAGLKVSGNAGLVMTQVLATGIGGDLEGFTLFVEEALAGSGARLCVRVQHTRTARFVSSAPTVKTQTGNALRARLDAHVRLSLPIASLTGDGSERFIISRAQECSSQQHPMTCICSLGVDLAAIR